MNKSFHQSLLAASVGAVMLAAARTASANSLLFPYFTTTAGAQSVLSLSNTGTLPVTQAVHYVYNYGTACTHYDASGSLTATDILSHSVAAPPAGGFGQVVGSDTSTPVYFPLPRQPRPRVLCRPPPASARPRPQSPRKPDRPRTRAHGAWLHLHWRPGRRGFPGRW